MNLLSAKSLFLPKQRKPVEAIVASIRQGDEALRNHFIQAYTGYILSVTAKATGRYIQMENDEAYAAALLAFNKAIDRYDPKRGASFFTFAGLLIHRELLDLSRQGSKVPELPLDAAYGIEGEGSQGVRLAHQAFKDQESHFYIKQEIEIYTSILQEYSLDFKALVKVSPKHKDTRKQMMSIARDLAENPEAAAKILHRKTLPMDALTRSTGLSRKTLERHRRYILANVILLCSDLEYLKDYVKEALKGGDGDEGTSC